jgi:hypothetical protein
MKLQEDVKNGLSGVNGEGHCRNECSGGRIRWSGGNGESRTANWARERVDIRNINCDKR